MAKFKITICNANPFKQISIMGPSSDRFLEVKASDEDRVRELWEGVKDLPEYLGYRIKKIELMPQS